MDAVTTLTPDERRLLVAMATTPKQRGSDSRVLRAVGLSQGEALQLANAARIKLGVDATESLRDAAIALYTAGSLT
jgi:hypothetical protein